MAIDTDPIAPQTPSPEQMAAQFHFAQLAVQYQAAGRFAAFSNCVPVAGNLLHHSIEMFLKCALARTLTMKEMWKIGHSLNKLWNLFKKTHTNPHHASLDSCVRKLDRFERLRYPDNVVLEGMQVLIVVRKSDFAKPPTGPQPPYHLVLEDIDLLAQTAVRYSGLESEVFALNHSQEQANHYLRLLNIYPIY
jgi:hypothetical protein